MPLTNKKRHVTWLSTHLTWHKGHCETIFKGGKRAPRDTEDCCENRAGGRSAREAALLVH